MKTYKLLTITPYYPSQDYLTLYSTDPKVIDWLLTELRHRIALFESRDIVFNPSNRNERYGCQIHKLKGLDEEVFWWIMALLCGNSWEPFAVTTSVATTSPQHDTRHSYQRYHLRLEVEAG